jgi:membrane protein YqaA with SNARE-associated domain
MHDAFAHLAVFLAPAPNAAHAHHGVLHFFRSLGLLGLFFTSVVDSSFVPLPVPGVTDIMLIVYAAAKSNPFMLVAIATVGSALGGLFSHAAGQAGGLKLLEKHVPALILRRVTGWMESHAVLSVSLPAILPPPMPLSPFVLVAGAVHMSRRKFMWSFTVSRCLRHGIAVWLGLRYGHAVIHLWQRFSAKWATTVLIGVWSAILVFTAVAIWKLYKASRTMDVHPMGKKSAATTGN